MMSSVLLSTVEEATAFLRSMNYAAQTRGDKYFRQGRVSQLEKKSPHEIVATVKGSGHQPYTVTLNFDPHDGWSGVCSCPLGKDCKHIYATLKTVLAEHSAARVQQLSGGEGLSDASPKNGKKKSAVPFSEEVRLSLNRDLKVEEKKFLQKLEERYADARKSGRIQRWDFDTLGLKLGGYGWDALNIWPSVPTTLREFWLYVAHAAQEHGVKVPEFMLPVTDLEEIQNLLSDWRRKQEVERWKQVLGNTVRSVASSATQTPPYELRARFGETSVSLEWKRPGLEEFEPLRITAARAFRDDLLRGTSKLQSGTEWLWETFSSKIDAGNALEIPYIDALGMERLGRLFRIPEFHALLVNFEGKPFTYSDITLCWQLDPAEDLQADYRLRIGRPDGLPMPPVLCVLEGRPPLFLTREIVFRGPPFQSGALASNRENVIPAPALETRNGATLLQSLGIALPPRLRERVTSIPLRMVITCSLQEQYPGSKTEMCMLQLKAQTPSGDAMESWTGEWTPFPEPIARKKKEPTTITLYDRSALRDGYSILSSLDARWDHLRNTWAMRVTKKFPEQFAAWLKSLPPDVKVNLLGELASFSEQAVAGRVRLDVTEREIDWFDLQIVLDVSDTTLTKAELKLLLDGRGGYVRLEGKGWRKLHFDLNAEEDEQLARLGLNPRELTSEPQRLHALQLSDAAAKKFLPEAQFETIQRRASEIKARVTPPLPGTIKANLRPYQLEGFHFLAYLSENNFGGILADDMGLGKTLQTLAWIEWLRAEARKSNPTETIPPSLVICPKSVTDNWRAEAEHFAPGLRVKIWTSGESSLLIDSLADADLHVINYNQLRLIGESLEPVRWLAVILDEGQYIKNPSSQTALVARALHARHRLILSGTPIENRLLDLWSLMSFAMPGVLGSRAQFATHYDSKEDPLARRRLSARVRPFLLRRTKAQVAKDLPDRIEEDLFCEMEGEQKTLYRAELKRAQQMLLQIQTQKQFDKERFHFLTSLLRLRQISCHPRLVKEDSKAGSAKVDALLEQIEPLMEEGHKVLVFSQFVEMLDILKEELEPKGWPLFYLSGSTENRGDLVQQFQATEGAGIFLISLKAGGFGLNLTAASYVVLFDPWWNPAVENQAIDRTHRIGQTRNVIAYRLLIKDSIEEKIRRLQKQKSALADDVLGEEKFAQSLTLDDLHFLFSDTP